MKTLITLLTLVASSFHVLSAADYIQVKELMEKKEIKDSVSFKNLSEFLNDYVVGTALQIERKEGKITGIALTAGFVELAEKQFSPLVSASRKEFLVPLDGAWVEVKVSEETTYTIRLVRGGYHSRGVDPVAGGQFRYAAPRFHSMIQLTDMKMRSKNIAHE